MTRDASRAPASEQAARLRLALDGARRAASLALARFQDETLRVETKMDRTLVTEADRDAEALLRELIAAAFPADAVVGEEHGTTPGTSGWTWYLDPIDGTQSYARGVPLFGTLVGVTLDGECRAGVIDMPALGERVWAAAGEGCWWERAGRVTPARVSPVRDLGAALFCTTSLRAYAAAGRAGRFEALSAATGVVRGWSDCYGYALVATGRAEIAVDPLLASWDAGPMPVILAEAGGRFTSFDGRPGPEVPDGVATNGHLHDAVLAMLASRPG